jgi:hypothetical protein
MIENIQSDLLSRDHLGRRRQLPLHHGQPRFLSGETPAELGVVKQCIEARTNPEIAEARAETVKALYGSGGGTTFHQLLN